jgi:multicomponent Na+:H+ antiporter subunit E
VGTARRAGLRGRRFPSFAGRRTVAWMGTRARLHAPPSWTRCFGLLARGKCWSIVGSTGLAGRSRQVAALALWSGTAWVLLTWTATVEQAAYGIAVALAVAVVLSPLGPVARPWRLVRPGRFGRLAAMGITSLTRILSANLGLARRVWSPSLPLRTGMLIVPTDLRTDGPVTVVGLLGSLVVEYQLVDLEPGRLQYHAVWVASEDPSEARERINGRVEDLLRPFDQEASRD